MFVKETKRRTVYKGITWRMVAVINSWAVLSISLSHSNILNAIFMNITGFALFYLFERVWSKINYGRHILQEKTIDDVNE